MMAITHRVAACFMTISAIVVCERPRGTDAQDGRISAGYRTECNDEPSVNYKNGDEADTPR